MCEALATRSTASAVFGRLDAILFATGEAMPLDDLLSMLDGAVRKLFETTDKALRVEISIPSLRIQRLVMAGRAIKKLAAAELVLTLASKIAWR